MEVKATFEIGQDSEIRLQELMLYIAKKCSSHSKFGGTKHNKILWFADFNAYRLFGKPITGARYWRQDYGPVASRFMQAKNKLISDKRAKPEVCIFPGFNPQRRIIALDEPNLDLFSAKEIALVDQIIDELKELSVDEVSKLSHGRAWKAAMHDYTDIPYEAAFVSDEPLLPEENARFKELIISRGWGEAENS
jgi:hypothetical protein